MPDFLALGNFANQIIKFKKSSNHSKNFILKTGKYRRFQRLHLHRRFCRNHVVTFSKEKNYGKIFNVCSGESRNIKEILIKMISNSRLKIDLIQEDSRLRNNDIKNHYGCNKRMISSLGSYSFTDFEDSIKKLV